MNRSVVVGILVVVGLVGLVTTGLYAAFTTSILLGFMLLFGLILALGIIAGMSSWSQQ